MQNAARDIASDIIAEIKADELANGCSRCGTKPQKLDNTSKHVLEVNKEGEINKIKHYCHYCIQD